MVEFALTLGLRDDPAAIARYKAEHRRAWPAVIEALRRIGIRELKIFLLGRTLFMWLEADEGFDPNRDFGKLSNDPRYREWEELMESLQERASGASEDEWWAVMEKVFDLNWPHHASGTSDPR